MKLPKPDLKAVAQRNVSVSVKESGAVTELKSGIAPEHSMKHEVPHESTTPRVGLSIGCTLNVGDYRSFRVDAWLSDNVQSDETPEQAYVRIQSVLSSVIEEVTAQYIPE
jgi:hypothetical protein